MSADGCCYYSGTSCQWCPGGHVGGPTDSHRWSANCNSTGQCDAWNKGKWCVGTCSGISFSTTTTTNPWQLAWSDEFNACPNGRPDPANWGYETGYVRNSEVQWYQEDNAACVDGSLVITSRRESPPDWVTWSRGNYTSSSLISKGLQTFDYGRYELRAKIPIESGSWPAWWMVGSNGVQWPNNGEIDMMEYYRGKVLANFAYGDEQSRPVWSSGTVQVDAAWASWFHIWAMEWDETMLTITLDGRVVNTFRVSEADGYGHLNTYRGEQWHMFINTALGGANGGDPSWTTFPLKYEVDYVRYYRRK